MLRRSEFIIDERPIRIGRQRYAETISWEDWLEKHPRLRENWLFSVIELLLKNNDWAGAFLLVNTYISTCKQSEGTRIYNRTPFDESCHVRVVKRWFWSRVEEYGFALPEEEIPYEDRTIDSRREINRKAAEDYPFVGGKPKRRYSETSDFFKEVEADRRLQGKPPLPITDPKPRSGKSRGIPKGGWPRKEIK